MSLFSAGYDPVKDVQISTCLTAYTDEYGKKCIIVFNKVVWFGTIMDHLLINPNQIWMAGILVSDDTFDDNQNLGITHEKLFIPFVNDATTLYFDSRVPTKREITECTHIVTTGDT